jgi:uncharacterized metal-binding protein YceD (DUF177 family)
MIPLIAPELPHSLRYDAVPAGGCEMTVRADAAACEALAARMQIPAVLEFSARFVLSRAAGRVVAAQGWLQAAVALTCVVTSEAFEMRLEEEFDLHFVPAGTEEAEPDPDSIDEIPYEDGVLAIGEAAAEQLALALPAFPRGPDAGDYLEFTADDDAISAGPASPFAMLAAGRKPV